MLRSTGRSRCVMNRSSHLIDSPSADVAAGYLELAMVGLSRMFDPNSAGFPQTARLAAPPASNFTAEQPELVFEGHSVRDTAIAALGISQLQMPDQRTVLTGLEAADLV